MKSGSMKTGAWIRSDKRLAIYLRDEFRCCYCGKIMCHISDPRDLTLDHIISRSAGGGNNAENLITACRSCNSARGAKRLAAWADEATRKTIRRNTARKLGKYLRLARKIMERGR